MQILPTQLLIQEITFESITLDTTGTVVSCDQGRTRVWIEPLGPGALKMSYLPGGIYQMGSSRGGFEDERPQHIVAVAPFWMACSPETQWRSLLSKRPPCRFRGDDLPVDNVSWKDAAAFCKALARRTGRAYRLPSEAEWVYACRAGTTTPFHTGETITTEYANFVGEHTYAQEKKGIYRHTTTPAGTFLPNSFGLFDLHGGLWE